MISVMIDNYRCILQMSNPLSLLSQAAIARMQPKPTTTPHDDEESDHHDDEENK